MFLRGCYVVIAVLLLWALPFVGLSQHRCATPIQSEQSIDHFENWLKSRPNVNRFGPPLVYTIPVVFHVIHNGEAIGFGENISTERIQDQVDRLNEDFRGMNPRSSSIPTEFLPVVADVQIEFRLARQDPNGLPTNGIVRKQGSRTSYNLFSTLQLNQLKEESYWDSERYMNIWIAETGGVIGIASWPDTTLPGVSNPETNPIHDGVIVDNDFIGTNLATDGSFDSYGQTLTHEIGHFLGLRHIWGDGVCANDYCDDTPEAQTHHGNSGSLPVVAPCSFPGPDSCTEDALPDMFMNFMDYTNDECLNMFTLEQKSRMRTVLENSPRRLSLLTSPGLEDPIGVLDNDVAFVDFFIESPVVCSSSSSTQLVFANYGINSINSFEYTLDINGSSQSIEVTGLNLGTGEQYVVDQALSGLQNGSNNVSWSIQEINGVSDENPLNDEGETSVVVSDSSTPFPLKQDFESSEWIIPVLNNSWSALSQAANSSMSVQAFQNPNPEDTWLISPLFSLEGYEEVGLFMDFSYGIRSGITDVLSLYVQTGCDQPFVEVREWQLDDLDFQGSESAWNPDSNWLTEFLSLDVYAGTPEMRIALAFTNNGGNNFYLDNIELTNNSDRNQPRPDEGEFVVYPNPARDQFTVTLQLPDYEDVIIQLYDMTGGLVLEERHGQLLNQSLVFQTGSRFGMYFLRVSSKSINETKRILIGK